jgi:hypothetical protein
MFMLASSSNNEIKVFEKLLYVSDAGFMPNQHSGQSDLPL